MKRFIMYFSLFITHCSLLAQPIQLDMSVFSERRKEFSKRIDSTAAAIFAAKPEYIRNGDVEYDYRQESNFYYLSGFEEPQSILLVNPSHPRYKYVMFVRKRDPRRETFDGPRAGTEGAISTFQADTALYFDDFEKSVLQFIKRDRTLYYTFGINPEIDSKIQQFFSGKTTPLTDPSYILSEMRLIKNDGDWKMGMSQTIDISMKAHLEAFKAVRSGMNEGEIQAVFESVYRKNGSPRNGYPCIIGSGPNSTILHYNKNTRAMNDGELLLMDCASEYGGYSADITRTVPVNGKFSKRQRDIYELVLTAQNTAMKMIKPGLRYNDWNIAIDSVLGNGLVKLGFIKDKKDFRVFSLHGYGHWIGQEVHDVGAYTINGESRKLEPGMVFTIEPGLYVRPQVFEALKEKGYDENEIAKIRAVVEPYMNIGVRIEDDILVTNNGYKNLSSGVPREIDAIEKAMKSR